MSRRMKIICAIMFSFSLCFIGFGYAALTDVIELVTDVSGEAQNEVFITNVVDPTSNAAIDGFYSTMLDHNINLAAGETATYTVQLYNNSKNGYTYIYDGHTCYDLPEGVTISVVEKTKNNTELVTLTTNVISSLIKDDEYDYFEVTYTNTSDVVATITNPIKFNYTRFTDQIKIVFEYGDVEYIKYSGKVDNNVYEDVVFNQIPIVLNEENRVARCNNNGLLETETTDGNTYLKVTNITNYKGVAAGEEAIYCDLFSTLTGAVNYNAGKFLDDSSPNGFVVLQNLGENVEPSGNADEDEMTIVDNRNYRININSKNVLIYNTIQNYGRLNIYDVNSTKGLITISDADLLHNYGNYVKDTDKEIVDYTEKEVDLLIDNVRLYLDYTIEEKVSNSEEYKAIVVGFDGLVKITNSDLHTDYGYGVYKKSANAGVKNRKASNYESKIVVEDTTLISDYNNAVRFADGTGIISLVNSYVASCIDLSVNWSEQTITDPIFVDRHPLETVSVDSDAFASYYANGLTDIKVYVTGGTLVRNSANVNHFFVHKPVRARIYYTATAKFATADSGITTLAARIEDGTFKYPASMINGSANNSIYTGDYNDITKYYKDKGYFDNNPLYNSDGTINEDNYMNQDGWYYIYTTLSSDVKKGDYSYQTQKFISDAKYEHLIHDGKKVMVGDYFEMINFNTPGESYLNITRSHNEHTYTDKDGVKHTDVPVNTQNFYGALTSISEKYSQSDYDDIECLFTFLASGDQRYFNIASLAYLDCVFHIENAWKNSEETDAGKRYWDNTEYNAGIKFLSTKTSGMPLDHINQRFTIMKYDHVNAEANKNADSTNYPYIFVSKFGSTFSYLMAKKIAGWDENGKVYWDKTKTGIADIYLTGINKTNTVPGYLDGNGTPYSYRYDHDDYAHYLMANVTGSGFQRNGWYLWQNEVPKEFTRVWRDVKYYNLTTAGNIYGDSMSYGNVELPLDSNTTIKVSSEARINQYGVYLRSNHADNIDSDGDGDKDTNGNDWGYIIVSSDTEMKGIAFHIKRAVENRDYMDVKVKVYQQKYNSSLSSDTTPYKEFTIPIGKTGDETNIYIEKLFADLNGIYTVIIDPFDDGGYDNTMLLKTITVIGEEKNLE